MRTILLELERVYNHIADIGAIATDVGFVVANAHAGRLREMVLRAERGADREPAAARDGVRRRRAPRLVRRAGATCCATRSRELEREFDDLVALVQSSDSTRDRLEHTGILRPETAAALGIVGVGGRASGVDLDVRRDHPYAAYDRYPFARAGVPEGDVLHRMQVRIDEVRESFAIICARPPTNLPDGPHRARAPQPMPPDRCALGAVEGLARRDPALGAHGAGQSPGALQDQRSVGEQLARAGGSGAGQHHRRFPGDQQELQSLLLGDGPLDHVQDSAKGRAPVGIATVAVPGCAGA